MKDTLSRPYVYRQLVPLMAWGFQSILHIPPEAATRLVIALFTVGLVVAARYLYTSMFEETIFSEMYVSLLVIFSFLLVMMPAHSYDISTAALFTFGLALLKRKRLDAYCLLFPLLVLNRETAFLLTIVLLLYYRNKLTSQTLFLLTVYQIMVYVGIRAILWYLFRGYPGHEVEIRLQQNISGYLSQYFMLYSFVLMSFAIISMIHSKWIVIPYFLKVCLLVILPIQFVLFMLVGSAFELRVFLESLPVIVLIGVQRVY